MNDGSIKIVIGAAMDRSVESVFGAIEKRAQKAGQNIGKSFSQGIGGGGGSGNGGMSKGFDGAAAAAHKAEREIEREIANQVKATKAGNREMLREHAKSKQEAVRLERETGREIIRQFRDITRARKKELDQQARDDKKAADQANRPSRMARHFGMYAQQNLMPGSLNPFGRAKQLGSDLMRGAGVDLSVSGSVARAVQLQSGSVQLANQERIATGSTIGSNKWNSITRDIGDKYSTNNSDVQGMMLAMTAKTGEFKNAASIGSDLASLGVASGANLTDLGNAAGYVYNQLSRLPDAGKRTIEVMRGIVGQTAVGAVDMPDYAKQLGRIAANAGKFEGNVGDNIRKMSALAQLSVEAGGASSPADAARAVGSFANTFGKHARISAFEAIRAPGFEKGINLFTNDNKDTLRDPFEIVKDAFRATKGNIPVLSNLFADTLGRKPVQALANSYKAAGGGEEGIKAIQSQYDKYMHAILTKETEAQNIKDYQESTAAKAQKFQNNLDQIVTSAADKIFPALEKLAPMALQAADALGGLATFAANNPMGGVAAALGLAIANAGIQSVVRSSFEKLMMKAGDTSLALGLVATAAIALAALIEDDVDRRNKEQNREASLHGNAGVSMSNFMEGAKKGLYSEQGKSDIEAINKNLEARVANVGKLKRNEYGVYNKDASEWELTAESIVNPDKFAARQDAAHDSELIAQLEATHRMLEMIRSGVLSVRVTNAAEIGAMEAHGPKVYAPGRQLDAGGLPAYLLR
jgi:hypothetical protein